jgi:hypothetical protein
LRQQSFQIRVARPISLQQRRLLWGSWIERRQDQPEENIKKKTKKDLSIPLHYQTVSEKTEKLVKRQEKTQKERNKPTCSDEGEEKN